MVSNQKKRNGSAYTEATSRFTRFVSITSFVTMPFKVTRVGKPDKPSLLASLSDIHECILPVSHKANTSSEPLPLDTLTVATGIKPRVSKSDALDAQAELLLLEAAAGAAEDLSGFCEPEESDCLF